MILFNWKMKIWKNEKLFTKHYTLTYLQLTFPSVKKKSIDL